MKQLVGIVILNFNNFEDTFHCIDSIEAHNTFPIKYFVVDNASPRQGVVQTLDEGFTARFGTDYLKINDKQSTVSRYPRLTFIVGSDNGGYAQGNNKALRHAMNDQDVSHVMILNNDILFIEDIIADLVSSIDRLPQCGIVSPLLYKRDRKTIDYTCARTAVTLRKLMILNLLLDKPWFGIKQRLSDEQFVLKHHPEYLSNDYVIVDYPSGSCMLAVKELWKAIDGFDPNTFLYYEEAILFRRTKNEGRQNYLLPSLRCVHLGGSTINKEASPRQTIMIFNSKKYYMLNYIKTGPLLRGIIRLTLAYEQFALFVRFKLFRSLK